VSAAIGRLFHRPAGVVRVLDDDDPGVRRQMQQPKHVARRQRRHEQLFRVVPARIATERRIGRTEQGRLVRESHLVGAVIRPIVARSGAAISRPGEVRRVRVGGVWHGVECGGGGGGAL
jgi:hypothetical protein